MWVGRDDAGGALMGPGTAAITNALPDVPRLCTAICEWAACVVYLAVVPLRVSRRRTVAAACLGLVAIVAVQYGAGAMPLTLWVAGMTLAVAVMWAVIWLASGAGKREAVYLTARAFVLAELVASLHWQLATFLAERMGMRPDGWGGFALLAVTYAACFAAAWAMERRNFGRDEPVAPTVRDAVGTSAITIITFAMSNLSFVSTNTPFSGTVGQEVFYIRTLVDLCGFAMLYAQQEQVRSTRATLELASINAQRASQHAEYLQSKENIEQLGRLAHDLKHQIAALRAELDPDRVSAQFERLEASVAHYGAQQHTGDPVLDVILTTKMRACADRGITLTAVADGKLLAGMDAMDVASLFGNVLDNAIEAASRVTDPDRRLVKLALSRQGSFAVVHAENTYDTPLRRDRAGGLVTTKADQARHGFGVKSIRHIARSYGGELTIEATGPWFDLRVLLPLPLAKRA